MLKDLNWKYCILKEGSDDRISENLRERELNVDYIHPAPAIVSLVVVVAGMMLSESIKILTKFQEPCLLNKLKEFNFDDMSFDTKEFWEKQPDCPICSKCSTTQ